MALVVGSGASAALANEPTQSGGSPPATATPRAANNTRASEPASFDIAASLGPKRGVAIYRYQRAEKKLVLLERHTEVEGLKKTQSFNKISSMKNAGVALAPEGGKKPPPPPPGGGERGLWIVPEAELQAAVKELRAQEPSAGELFIGQLPAATAPAR